MKTRITLTYLLFLAFVCTLSAQNSSSNHKRVTKFEVGYMMGGTPSNHYFAFNEGFSVNALHGVLLSKHFTVSGGLGFEELKEGNLMPMFLDVEAYSKSGKGYFNFRSGYSVAWSSRTVVNENYKYRGGFLFSVGYGFRVFQNPKFKVHFMPSYNFRQTRLNYLPGPDSDPYTAIRRIHLLSLKLAVTI